MRADRVLAVATSLTALDSDALRRILTERAVSVTTDSHPLDIAQQVLEPEAVTNQLGYLTADDLARLQGALSTADSSGLIEDDAARLLADGPGQSVSVEVADALADIPDPSSAPSPQSVPAAVDAVAIGAALEKIETLLAVLSTRPVPGPGVSSLEDWAMTHGDEPELWREASGVCRSVGLVVLRHGVWELTEQARTWTAGSLSERWAWLAEALWAIRPGWLDATSAPTRDHTAGWFQAAARGRHYPRGGGGVFLARAGDPGVCGWTGHPGHCGSTSRCGGARIASDWCVGVRKCGVSFPNHATDRAFCQTTRSNHRRHRRSD
jgi:hypothetical protein